MLGKIIPILLALIGIAGGIGAGLLLRPTSPEAAEPAQSTEVASAEVPIDPNAEPQHEYVKLNNQFIVPVVEKGRVAALVVLSLSLEVAPGLTERVYALEPKLRDAMLQVLFDHANSGGFSGSFTDGANLVLLRQALLEVTVQVLGDKVTDVLIVDIVRQDN